MCRHHNLTEQHSDLPDKWNTMCSYVCTAALLSVSGINKHHAPVVGGSKSLCVFYSSLPTGWPTLNPVFSHKDSSHPRSYSLIDILAFIHILLCYRLSRKSGNTKIRARPDWAQKGYDSRGDVRYWALTQILATVGALLRKILYAVIALVTFFSSLASFMRLLSLPSPSAKRSCRKSE